MGQIEEKIQRMIRPEALKKNEPLFWSPGIGTDVWEMFCAAMAGDLETIKRLLDKDPSLVLAEAKFVQQYTVDIGRPYVPQLDLVHVVKA